ncbi:unnamed protein product [Candidula unifasciata]|uniref:Uncharacterized protein n=1 Tax=Candidula unifasciata TaxID=100452 RepID=A0A8S3ZGS4_9EUPU|nr:unnamed protein product [Candidula unifasciata]
MKQLRQVTHSLVNNNCSPRCPPVFHPVCPSPDHSTEHYQFRYDDGYSSQIGAVRLPLILGQPSRDGEFVFRHPPSPLEKPLRILPASPVPWWPPVCVKTDYVVQQAAPPRYCRIKVDDPRCLPNETIIKHF